MEAEAKEPKLNDPTVYLIGTGNQLIQTVRPKELEPGWVLIKRGQREFLLNPAQAEEYERAKNEYLERKASETRKKRNKRKIAKASKKRNRG